MQLKGIKQQGFSLVEVLISAVIATIALLALGTAQLRALQFATSSFQYTVATIEASNVGEQLWPHLCDIIYNGEYGNIVADMALTAPGYNLNLPANFNVNYNVEVTWNDERLDNNVTPSVVIFPQYPNLAASDCP